MAKAFMAYPELRDPYVVSDIHPKGCATILYQGKAITLSDVRAGDGLLIKPKDLREINGFEVKPEGACFKDLCVPLGDQLLVDLDGQQWFDLAAFADSLGQPYVVDFEANVWSFAEIPAKRENTLVNAMAPDIELADRSGNVFRLADLKGKKALIVTWSSW